MTPVRSPDDPDLTVSSPALLEDGSDRRFRQFVHDTLAFAARIEEIRDRFGEFVGLTGSQYTILISIAHLQDVEGVGVAAVVEHLHLSGAFVTIEVNKLVTAGFVEKRVNPGDRRRVLLTATERARGLLAKLTGIQAPANDALFGCLDAAGFQLMSTLMGKLVGCGDKALALLDFQRAQAAGGD